MVVISPYRHLFLAIIIAIIIGSIVIAYRLSICIFIEIGKRKKKGEGRKRMG